MADTPKRLNAAQRAAVLRRQAEQEGRGMSAPMRAVFNVRLSSEERDALQQMADECNVTLSWAIREGTRLYLQEQLQRHRLEHGAGQH